MKTLLTRFAKDESGATAIEYGLIAAFMSVALIALLPLLTNGLSVSWNNIQTNLSTPPAP